LPPLRGVLCVNKPSGISSYDVIRRLKPLLPAGMPIGHAGTLDPLASGLLIVLIGAATKISRFLIGADKEYEAGVLFGTRTDTDDVTGKAVERAEVPELSRDQITAALARFTGTIEQTPPAFSALKQDGQPLYELARAGETVHPKPRPVTIYHNELLAWEKPRLRLRCRVSSGTYIRALARDLGEALGVPATIEALTRTAVGSFRLDQAFELDALTRENLPGSITPIPDALADWPRVDLDSAGAARLRRGQPVLAQTTFEGLALARTKDGRFLAIVNASGLELLTERIIHVD
jgi:tRNA pseudouridine55 synthase